MPAKKAPEANKNSPKVERAEDKKQAGGAQKGGQKPGQAAAQAQPTPRKPLSSDPVEAAIQRKLDDWEDKIKKFADELEKNKKDADGIVASRKKLFEQQEKLRQQQRQLNDSKEASNQRKEAIESLKEHQRLVALRQQESKAMREKLFVPIRGKECDTPAGQEAYVAKIDTQVRDLEKAMSSSAFSLQDEKRKVDEISQLQKAKKTFKEWVGVKDKIAEHQKAIDDIRAELDKTKDARESRQAEREAISEKLDKLKEEIEKSFKAGNDLAAARDVVWKSKQDAHGEVGKERDNLQVLRKKKWQEDQEKRKEDYEKRQKERAELAEKRKERDAERQKEEDLAIPYENEIDICTNLTQYLESLLPQKPKDESSPAAGGAAVPEGDVTVLKKDVAEEDISKKKGRKQKAVKTTQDLKHNIEVFGYFEALSLTPPKKVSEIEASINELKEKKAHFNKLSTAVVAQRQEAAKAAAAASASQATTEAKQETTPAAEEVTAQ